MADKITWYGVYHRDGDGMPMALFTEGDAAQVYRRTLTDPADATMVAEADGTGRNADVAGHFKALEAPAVANPDDLQETLIRNQLRSEETDRRRRERLQAEVKRELDEAEAEKPKDDTERGERADEPSRPVARPSARSAATPAAEQAHI